MAVNRALILPIASVLLLATVGAALAAPPSGRPPLAPLERYEPKRFKVEYNVVVAPRKDYQRLYERDPEKYRTTPTFIMQQPVEINFPIIFQSTFSSVEVDSLNAQTWVSNRSVLGVNEGAKFIEGLPFEEQVGQFAIDPSRIRGLQSGQALPITELRWQFDFTVETYSSRIIDEAAAANIPWPREFPEEVRAGLAAQQFIESDQPIFKQAVQEVTQGRLRNVAPYYAAKELLRYCVQNIRVMGEGVRRGEHQALMGMQVNGALRAAQSGEGTEHDLVCVCVATLRAAGIPARPVIGLIEPHGDLATFASWMEFYIPNMGWIPVDPMRLRGGGVRNRPTHRAWEGFGNIENLNDRIPVSFHFIPPVPGAYIGWPALWSWDARGLGLPLVDQHITFHINEVPRRREDQRR